MSKAKLKKEISTFTREQLVEVVLDAYGSSAAAKKYFEYFLEPDSTKLREEKENIIAKELNRSKWGTCKGRISVIKNALKEFVAFKGDAETYAKLTLNTLVMMMGQQQYLDYTEALFNGAGYVAVEYVRTEAELNGMEMALKKFEAIVSKFARARMAAIVRGAVKEYCASLLAFKPEKPSKQ